MVAAVRRPNGEAMQGASFEDVFDDGALPLGEDLRAAVVAWLAHLQHERGSTANTLDAYERDLRQFLAWLKADLGHAPCLADLARLDAKRFRAFMASRRRAGFASRSLARTMSALRAFFRWLEAQEIAKYRGVLQVTMPKVPHGIPKPLTVEKAAAVVDGGAAAELDWVAARDTAVLLLLYGCGLAHLRGPLPAAQGRATRRPRRPAHRRQGRQGAAGAGAAHRAGGRCPLHRPL